MWSMKRIIVHLICFLVAWTSSVPAVASANIDEAPSINSEVYVSAPNTRVIHVSSEEYSALETQLINKGYRQNAQQILLARNSRVTVAGQTQITAVGNVNSNDCNDSPTRDDSGDASVNLSINIMNDLTPRDGGVEAAVVFVIIGAVVVVVWTLYAVKFLYDVAVGAQPCGRWSELNISVSSISRDSHQHADFSGLHLMTGYRDGATDVGISAEAGYADILLSEAGTLSLDGLYWMVGPMLRWRLNRSRNPSYYEMEFSAGTSEHPEIGLLARAKAGLRFGIGNALRGGVNLGVLNINLNDTQGIITDRHRYYYLLGIEMGYRF